MRFLLLAPPGKPNTTPLLLSPSVMSHSATPWTAACPDFPVLHYHLEFAQTHIHWVSDAIQPSHPLLPTSPPAFNLSQHQSLISNESAICIRWPKNWSFNFSICPSNEYSGLIFFRTDSFDLLAVQGTLKSLFQDHSSKVSFLWCSTFFMVYEYWKNHSFDYTDFSQPCNVSAF